MKNYEEITESVFQKSEEIIKRNRRRRNTMMKIGASAGCLIVVGAVGVSVWANGNKIPTESSGQFISDSAALAFGAGDTVYNGAFVGDTSSRPIGIGGVAEKIPQDSVTNSESSRPAGVGGLAEKIENNAGNMPIMGPDFDTSVPIHYTTIIGRFEIEDNERKIAPPNGQIHISKALNAAMEKYGDVDENGNEIVYRVVIEYLQDQRTIEPTYELFESESARVKEQLGLGLGFETYSWDWGAHSKHYIHANFSKAQIEKFTANPDYGYVIELYDNYNGFQTNTNCGEMTIN